MKRILIFLGTSIQTYKWILGILTIAMLLRGYNIHNYGLGFDQIQILQNAEKIAQADFTLIGPVTGPANMHTGPLIYYIAGAIYWIFPSPYSVAITALLIALITGVTLALLTKRYIPSMIHTILAIWGLSPFVIHLDRIPWNPNLTLLASTCVFFPFVRSHKKGALKLVDHLVVSLGIFLGYQAHFSGLFLLPLAIALLFLKQRRSFGYLFLYLGALAISLSPTILFDLRYEMRNYNGVVELFNNRVGNTDGSVISQLLSNIKITVENIGKMIFKSSSYALIITTGLAMFAIHSFQSIKTNIKQVTYIWIALIIIGFSLYRYSMPEYYFTIQFPAIFVLIASLVSTFSSKTKRIIIILFTLYTTTHIINTYSQPDSFSISNQIELSNEINNIITANPKMQIVYDMEMDNAIALEYLIDTTQTENHSNQPSPLIHIVYPYQSDHKKVKIYQKYAYWLDYRTQPTMNYLETDEFILKMEKPIQLYKDYYLKSLSDPNYTFLLLNDSLPIGWYAMYINHTTIDELKRTVFTDKDLTHYSDWEPINDNTIAKFSHIDTILFTRKDNSQEWDEIKSMLNKIQYQKID